MGLLGDARDEDGLGSVGKPERFKCFCVFVKRHMATSDA